MTIAILARRAPGPLPFPSIRIGWHARALWLVLAASACEPGPREPEPGEIPDGDDTPEASTDPELRALFDERVDDGFRGAVLVEHQGLRRLAAGAGTLSESSLRAPDGDTAFDCGSIMKDVTAATLFLLEEQGVLSRQQTLAEQFDDVPDVWSSVTLDEVIAHRAGFDEYHDTEGDFEPMDRDTALARIFAQEPLFEPGTESAYSNSGYTLLAAVIEQATGEEYRAAVSRRVFEPLGMIRSGFYGDPLWGDGNVAVGSGADVFAGNDPSRWPAPSWALLGNGGLVSTLEDLLRLARGFAGDELFRPETRQAFERAQPRGVISGRAVIGFAGGNDFGFNAVVAQVASDSTFVIAASHVESPVNAEILGLEILETLYAAELEIPEGD